MRRRRFIRHATGKACWLLDFLQLLTSNVLGRAQKTEGLIPRSFFKNPHLTNIQNLCMRHNKRNNHNESKTTCYVSDAQ